MCSRDFQRSYGVERFIGKRQRLVLFDHHELGVIG